MKDGSTATHTAEALGYWHDADGAIVVEAACCSMVGGTGPCSDCQGDSCTRCNGSGQVKLEDTRSRHTFYDVGRQVSNGSAPISVDPEAEVRAHVQRVAEHHAAVHRVKSFKLDALMKAKP